MFEAKRMDSEDDPYPQPGPPKRAVAGGNLYIDGIMVQKWQLTPEELKQYFPDEYKERYGDEEFPICPYPACDFLVTAPADLRQFSTHLRFKHQDWYESHRSKIEQCRTFESIVGIFIAEEQGRA